MDVNSSGIYLEASPRWNTSTHGTSLCHCKRTALNHSKEKTETGRDLLLSTMQRKERLDSEVIIKGPCYKLAPLLTKLHSSVQNVDHRE